MVEFFYNLKEWLMEFFNSYPTLAWVLLAVVLAVGSYFLYLFLRRNFFMLRLYMRIPFIGGIATASRKTFHDNEWFDGEKWLCRKFHDFYRYWDRDEYVYMKYKDYLGKIDEIDRRPIPYWAFILLIVMIAFEAFTFSVILADYLIVDASEYLSVRTGWFIALIVAILLYAFTHAAGAEMYKNSIVSRINGYNQGGETLHPDLSINLENTFNDNKKPIYQQMLNRFKSNAKLKKNYTFIAISVIFMLFILTAASILRVQTHDRFILQETATMQTNVFEDPRTSSDFNENQNKVENKLLQELREKSRSAGWVSYTFIGLIFLGIQIFGVFLGYSYGFAGKESKKAWKYTRRFRSLDEFRDFYNTNKNYVGQIAQENLSTLQSKIVKKVAKGKVFDITNKAEEIAKNSYQRSFLAYARSEKHKERSMSVISNKIAKEQQDSLKEILQ